MKKSVIVIAVVLFVTSRDVFSDVQARANGIELLQRCGCVDSVSSTPTSLSITFRLDGFMVRRDGKTRGTAEYIANNEALIVTPDQEVSIYEYGSGVRLTPISFKNGEKGLRIMTHFNAMSIGGGIRRTFAYIVLGDTPTPMSADDVEMIWDSQLDRTGNPTGWRLFEAEKEVEVLQIRPENAVPPPVQAKPPEPPPEPPAVTPPEPIKTPVNIAEDEPSEGKSKATTLWLYAIIPLCLLAILWLVRKKRKRDSL